MRSRSCLVAVACVLAVLAPATAPAGHGAGTCGSVWTGSRSCLFYTRGLPIVVEGSAFRESGEASVHVWATLQEANGLIVLVECADRGQRSASCREELTVDRMLDSTKQLVLIGCFVEGVGTGNYECQSALGF